MGMCLDDFGDISIEVRRKSFYLNVPGEQLEIDLDQLNNLADAVADAQRYVYSRREQPTAADEGGRG